MENLVALDKKIIISLIITSLIVVLNDLEILLIGLLLLTFLIPKYRNSLIFGLIIIFFISFIGEDRASIRDFIILISLVILFIFFLKRYGFNFNHYPEIPKPIILFAGFFFLTIFFSTAHSGYHIQSLDSLLRTIIFFLISYVFFALIDSEKIIYYYIFSIIIASLVISVNIYVQIFESGYTLFLTSGFFARYTDMYSGNLIGLLFMISTLLTIGFLFLTKERGKKYLIYLLLLNNIIILIVIGSRITVAGVLLGSSIILYILRKRLFTKILVFTTILILFFLILPSFSNLISIYFRFGSLAHRDEIWSQGIQMFVDNPIFGIGPGLYHIEVTKYFSSSFLEYVKWSETQKIGTFTPHNYLIMMAAENGVFGILSVFYLLGIYIKYSIKSLNLYNSKRKDLYTLSLILTVIGVLIFIRSIFEVDGILNYGYITQDLPFWLLFGIQISLYQNYKYIFAIR